MAKGNSIRSKKKTSKRSVNQPNRAPDPQILKLFTSMSEQPLSTFNTGNKLLKKVDDPLAVLEAMRHSVGVILEDFEEHGNSNIAEYDGHNAAYWQEQKKILIKQIAQQKKTGPASKTFSDYLKAQKKKEQQEIKKSVKKMTSGEDEFQVLLSKIENKLNDPTEVIKAIQSCGKIIDPDDIAVQAWLGTHLDDLTGLVANAIRTQAVKANDAKGLAIAKAYGDLIDVFKTDGEHYETLLSLVIHVAVACRDSKFMSFIEKKMIPPGELTDPTTAFNVACLFAKLENKAALIKAVQVARSLGKEPAKFMNEANFAKYYKDAAFKKALSER
ncbi:MAG: hypothetical protein JNL11_16510 [Bdellovibrionaceae bacterium]|nr:hypothetical protein [Pseudobdellovibrionaceae bacterium]